MRWLLRRDILGVAGRASGSYVQQPGSASWVPFDLRTWRHLLGFPSTDARAANSLAPLLGFPSTDARGARDNVVYWKTNRKIKNDLQQNDRKIRTIRKSAARWRGRRARG